MTHLQELKQRLETIESFMSQTHSQLKEKNKSLFLISGEIEQLENPVAYAENSNHWDGHEIRL